MSGSELSQADYSDDFEDEDSPGEEDLFAQPDPSQIPLPAEHGDPLHELFAEIVRQQMDDIFGPTQTRQYLQQLAAEVGVPNVEMQEWWDHMRDPATRESTLHEVSAGVIREFLKRHHEELIQEFSGNAELLHQINQNVGPTARPDEAVEQIKSTFVSLETPAELLDADREYNHELFTVEYFIRKARQMGVRIPKANEIHKDRQGYKKDYKYFEDYIEKATAGKGYRKSRGLHDAIDDAWWEFIERYYGTVEDRKGTPLVKFKGGERSAFMDYLRANLQSGVDREKDMDWVYREWTASKNVLQRLFDRIADEDNPERFVTAVDPSRRRLPPEPKPKPRKRPRPPASEEPEEQKSYDNPNKSTAFKKGAKVPKHFAAQWTSLFGSNMIFEMVTSEAPETKNTLREIYYSMCIDLLASKGVSQRTITAFATRTGKPGVPPLLNEKLKSVLAASGKYLKVTKSKELSEAAKTSGLSTKQKTTKIRDHFTRMNRIYTLDERTVWKKLTKARFAEGRADPVIVNAANWRNEVEKRTNVLPQKVKPSKRKRDSVSRYPARRRRTPAEAVRDERKRRPRRKHVVTLSSSEETSDAPLQKPAPVKRKRRVAFAPAPKAQPKALTIEEYNQTIAMGPRRTRASQEKLLKTLSLDTLMQPGKELKIRDVIVQLEFMALDQAMKPEHDLGQDIMAVNKILESLYNKLSVIGKNQEKWQEYTGNKLEPYQQLSNALGRMMVLTYLNPDLSLEERVKRYKELLRDVSTKEKNESFTLFVFAHNPVPKSDWLSVQPVPKELPPRPKKPPSPKKPPKRRRSGSFALPSSPQRMKRPRKGSPLKAPSPKLLRAQAKVRGGLRSRRDNISQLLSLIPGSGPTASPLQKIIQLKKSPKKKPMQLSDTILGTPPPSPKPKKRTPTPLHVPQTPESGVVSPFSTISGVSSSPMHYDQVMKSRGMYQAMGAQFRSSMLLSGSPAKSNVSRVSRFSMAAHQALALPTASIVHLSKLIRPMEPDVEKREALGDYQIFGFKYHDWLQQNETQFPILNTKGQKQHFGEDIVVSYQRLSRMLTFSVGKKATDAHVSALLDFIRTHLPALGSVKVSLRRGKKYEVQQDVDSLESLSGLVYDQLAKGKTFYKCNW